MFGLRRIIGLSTAALLAAVAFSCQTDTQQRDRLPEAPVNVFVSKMNATTQALWQPGGIVVIGQPTTAAEAVGVGGIIAVHDLESNRYYAYDRACPIHPNKIYQLQIDGIEAHCPQCQSRYSLYYGAGAPIAGPAAKERIALRKYATQETPDGLWIKRF